MQIFSGKSMDGQGEESPTSLASEEPLSIRIDGQPYAVVMRTPGLEKAHVHGFALGEGLIDDLADVSIVALCQGDDANVVTMTLNPDRRQAVAHRLKSRSFVSQTSCGICGKSLISDIAGIADPVDHEVAITEAWAVDTLANLSRLQPLRAETKATHAAALFANNRELVSVAEDVGRHNALDKAVGIALLEGSLERVGIAVLSSRISYEMVQKSSRARTEIILALSRPTGLAVDIAKRLNMTIACLAGDDELLVFSGAERIL